MAIKPKISNKISRTTISLSLYSDNNVDADNAHHYY